MPGTLRGCGPVATMICFVAVTVWFWPSVISTLPRPARRPLPLIQSILFFLKRLDPAGQPLDDLVLPAVHLRHVEADGCLANRQAPLLPVPGDFQRVGVFQERLRRNAPPVEASATERRRALDDGGPETELSGPDCGNVAAGT
jgi:hypothetical protein